MGYLKRLLESAFSETRKFWNIHRNWTVAAGPIGGAIFRGFVDGWPKARTDVVGLSEAAVIGFVVSWLGTFIINLLRSPLLLDRDREVTLVSANKTIADLEAALERECFNLAHSPQLILGFNQEFFIPNIGKWDARDAKIHSATANHLLLYSDEISYVGPGDTLITLRCKTADRADYGSAILKVLRTGVQAFQMFIEEIIRSWPVPDAILAEQDPVVKATRHHQYLMMNDHILALSLMYSDFSGHTYLSENLVVWSMKDGGRIIGVRPQTIRKLKEEEARILTEGEYTHTVAGVELQNELPSGQAESAAN